MIIFSSCAHTSLLLLERVGGAGALTFGRTSYAPSTYRALTIEPSASLTTRGAHSSV